MAPTFFERVFTDHRPLYFLMGTGAAVTVGLTSWLLAPLAAASIADLFWCVAFLPVAAALGATCGAFPGGLALGILFKAVERRNGAPFHEGDEVVILSKRFPGRVARIHAVWAERHEVRVELDEQSRADVTDVFSYVEVRRRRPGEPPVE